MSKFYVLQSITRKQAFVEIVPAKSHVTNYSRRHYITPPKTLQHGHIDHHISIIIFYYVYIRRREVHSGVVDTDSMPDVQIITPLDDFFSKHRS